MIGVRYRFVMNGFMSLLMHSDNIQGSDEVRLWQKSPQNKGLSVAGDDRSPPWTWHTYCYHDGEHIVMPTQNIMTALRTAGAQMILKKQKTFKELTQSGLLIDTDWCDFFNNGKKIRWSDICELREMSFSEQAAAVKKLGFDLDVRRVRVGTSKHVRVRPVFRNWSVSGDITVLKQEITFDVLKQLFDLAGKAGLGDWRPSGKTPGSKGQSVVTVEPV